MSSCGVVRTDRHGGISGAGCYRCPSRIFSINIPPQYDHDVIFQAWRIIPVHGLPSLLPGGARTSPVRS
jgi:hypothetical protein